jgi:hypothetical protein
LKSNFPGNSKSHRCGIGFVIVDADLEQACRAWKALGPSLKKEETLALIPEENVLMDTEKAWISVRQLSAGFGTMLTVRLGASLAQQQLIPEKARGRSPPERPLMMVAGA